MLGRVHGLLIRPGLLPHEIPKLKIALGKEEFNGPGVAGTRRIRICGNADGEVPARRDGPDPELHAGSEFDPAVSFLRVIRIVPALRLAIFDVVKQLTRQDRAGHSAKSIVRDALDGDFRLRAVRSIADLGIDAAGILAVLRGLRRLGVELVDTIEFVPKGPVPRLAPEHKPRLRRSQLLLDVLRDELAVAVRLADGENVTPALAVGPQAGLPDIGPPVATVLREKAANCVLLSGNPEGVVERESRRRHLKKMCDLGETVEVIPEGDLPGADRVIHSAHGLLPLFV